MKNAITLITMMIAVNTMGGSVNYETGIGKINAFANDQMTKASDYNFNQDVGTMFDDFAVMLNDFVTLD